MEGDNGMTRKEAVDYFTNKYYELARKYRIYTRCCNNTQLMEMCINMAISCGLKGLECETVAQIPKEDLQYFLLIGDHITEATIILAKRNYVVADRVTKGVIRKNGGVYGNKK
jgi:hypothetical protein